MLYFDTSFLVPLFQEEATSVRVERFMQRVPAGEASISHWTKVEFASLLARDVRMGSLTADEAGSAKTKFDAIVDEAFVVLLPDADDFTLAGKFVGRHQTGLRGGDALHLAIAANRGVERIFSLDKAFVRAGKMLGLPADHGI
jgi:predicted nucleic acid-binding protein